MILEAKQLGKTYVTPARTLSVLEDVNFSLEPGEVVAIVGPSGSGKTTLLGLLAGLDRASSGSVILNGVCLDELDEDERAALRNAQVGFVFQNFQLMSTLTALENVMVPLELRGERRVAERAMAWLERVGLADRAGHYPAQLSGGEKQRIALARAFINEPVILFADEPTGNLDEETGAIVEDLIFELNRETGTTLVLVTHDLDLAAKAGRILRLKGGKVIEDVRKESLVPKNQDA